MGYTTDFNGEFSITPTLTEEHRLFLQKFNNTRRMARRVGPEYGIEGEWYVDGTGWAGQDNEPNIIDYNNPPSPQPGLWCRWRPTEEGDFLEWDQGKKFYSYIEWLEYLIEGFFKPKGYVLDGQIFWQGEESSDIGKISIGQNIVTTQLGKVVYE